MSWTRRPTGLLGGSPTGPRTKVSRNQKSVVAQRSVQLENECADTVASKGYRVHQNPTKQEVANARADTRDAGDPARNPDYLIEGHVFDCYSPTASKPVRGIWSEVSQKMGEQQTQRVTLNLQDWRGDLVALRKQFDDWPIPGLKELVAVTPNREIVQIVRRD